MGKHVVSAERKTQIFSDLETQLPRIFSREIRIGEVHKSSGKGRHSIVSIKETGNNVNDSQRISGEILIYLKPLQAPTSSTHHPSL